MKYTLSLAFLVATSFATQAAPGAAKQHQWAKPAVQFAQPTSTPKEMACIYGAGNGCPGEGAPGPFSDKIRSQKPVVETAQTIWGDFKAIIWGT